MTIPIPELTSLAAFLLFHAGLTDPIQDQNHKKAPEMNDKTMTLEKKRKTKIKHFWGFTTLRSYKKSMAGLLNKKLMYWICFRMVLVSLVISAAFRPPAFPGFFFQFAFLSVSFSETQGHTKTTPFNPYVHCLAVDILLTQSIYFDLNVYMIVDKKKTWYL